MAQHNIIENSKVDQVSNNNSNNGLNQDILKAKNDISQIKDDIRIIKKSLFISGTPSINYSYLPSSCQELLNQLVIDNLMMEDSLLNTRFLPKDKLFFFCTYAFLQIENLINYYFEKLQQILVNFNDVISYVKDNFDDYYLKNPDIKFDKTTSKKVERYHTYSPKNEACVDDIHMWYKTMAFLNQSYPSDKSCKFHLDMLRNVRNESVHRNSFTCGTIDPNYSSINKYFENPGLIKSVRETIEQVNVVVQDPKYWQYPINH